MWQRDSSDREKQYSGKLWWDSATGDPLGKVGVARAGAVTKPLLSSCDQGDTIVYVSKKNGRASKANPVSQHQYTVPWLLSTSAGQRGNKEEAVKSLGIFSYSYPLLSSI